MQLREATVMIVEDEPVLREIVGAWFARIAGNALTAGTGAEALEILAANHVDLVISDLRMPIMDGVTLLKKIMFLGRRPPSVIFISGFSDIDAREAYDLGAVALLEKPIDRQELLQAVKRSLLADDELWSSPLAEMPSAVLKLSYASLAAALQQHKIAFGRGGFCIALSQHILQGPVTICLEFKEDKLILEGSGMVRWTSLAEKQAGIELLYVTPASRRWLASLIAQLRAPAFIPAFSSRHSLPRAKLA